MVNATARVAECSLYVFRFQIGQFLKHLLVRKPSGEQIQDIDHPNAHPANARSPAALIWIGRNSLFPVHSRR